MWRGGKGEDIAHVLKRGMGWGFCERPEPADVSEGEKPRANAGNHLNGGSSHPPMT